MYEKLFTIMMMAEVWNIEKYREKIAFYRNYLFKNGKNTIIFNGNNIYKILVKDKE